MKLTAAIGSVALLGVSACGDVERPTGPPPTANVASAAEDYFYFHQGERIQLTLDRTEMVVGGESPVEGARRALADLGVQVADAGTLPGGFRRLRLTGPGATAIGVEERLRNSGQLRFVVPAFRPVGGGGPVLFLDRIDVQFKKGVTVQQVAALAEKMKLSLLRPPRPDSGFFAYRFRYPPGVGVGLLRLAAELDQDALVEWASPDKVSGIQISTVPSDPYYPSQFHLKNSTVHTTGVPVDINIEPGWSLTTGDKAIRVVVLDDGIQLAHPDLVQVLGGGMGYDLMHDQRPPGASDDAYTPYCNDVHGTSIGGIIGGRHDGAGIAGIAPGITVTIVRIFRTSYACPPDLPHLPQAASENDIAAGINWAWQYAGADVISNSWNNFYNLPNNAITAAISNAVQQGRGGKGTVVVFSAGNSANRSAGNVGLVLYPATLSTVIAVGAINRHGGPANYTPNGTQLALVAPSGHLTGSCIGEVVTTDLLGGAGCHDGPSGDQNYTSTFSGTSAAAPQVAATAALLLSREPNLTVNQVRSRLTGRADQWGPSITYGAGKLNAYRALYNPPPPTAAIAGPTSVRPNTVCGWTASVSGGAPPFTYIWYRNGSPIVYGSLEVATSFAASGTIEFEVIDGLGRSDFKSRSITVSAGAPMCLY